MLLIAEQDQRHEGALRRKLVLVAAGVEPKDIIKVTGLNSCQVTGAVNGARNLSPEAARALANLVRRQVIALFERADNGDDADQQQD